MKTLLTAALMALTASALTISAQAQTSLQVEPAWPVYCEKHDYPYVNQVSRVRKVSETSTQVTFELRTVVGSCDDKRFQPGQVINEAASVFTDRSKLILFQKSSVLTSEAEQVSKTDALVTLVFDKTRAFKKKNVVKYDMVFYPRGYTPPLVRTDAWGRTQTWYYNDLRFFWKLELSRMSDSSSELRVGVSPK
ncbi:MAG: hypothetical protein EOP05_21325 [Proteobacteria bacterium]|nr:MAG: hypothetical protein EOP05_21325 [Pseudomonadota bacterium]